VITKGWLRASHRALCPRLSTRYAPWYTHDEPQKLRPGKAYRFQIAVMPTAHRFRKGSRVRLELANGDSAVTESVFAHEYSPDKVGRDTIYHNARRPSRIFLPVIEHQPAA
jgi:predicted acyl esterase